MAAKVKVVKFKDREVNLGGVLPLKLGDWRRLEAKGLSPEKLENSSIGDLADFMFYILNKADPTITLQEVEDEFPLLDPRIRQVIGMVNVVEGKEELDRPT